MLIVFAELLKTNSSSKEWNGSEIAALAGANYAAPCARLAKETLTLKFNGSLLRLEIACEDLTQFELNIDGEITEYGSVEDIKNYADLHKRDYRIITIRLDESEHVMTLKLLKGVVPLYLVESYSGDFAVINSGIGSRPS